MTAPAVLFGAYATAALALPEAGAGDGATPVTLRVRSNRLAPEGAGGDHSFEAVILTLRHQAAQSVTLRVFVDDVLQQTSVLTLAAQPAVRARTLEVRLSVPVLLGGVDRARVRPRGAWVQVEVESTGTQPLAIDGCDIQYTAVRRR
jgi:hypothetical protein